MLAPPPNATATVCGERFAAVIMASRPRDRDRDRLATVTPPSAIMISCHWQCATLRFALC
jgi:hypothetical protein